MKKGRIPRRPTAADVGFADAARKAHSLQADVRVSAYTRAMSASTFWNQVQDLGIALAQGEVGGRNFRQRFLQLSRERMGCSRVSLWRFRQDPDDPQGPLLLVCKAAQHEDGSPLGRERSLRADQYHDCLAAMRPKGVRGSDDCLNDPPLRTLAEVVLRHADVRSLACAALLVNGRNYGLLCAEQLGQPRHWTRQQLLDLARLARTISLQVVRGAGPKHMEAPSLPALPPP